MVLVILGAALAFLIPFAFYKRIGKGREYAGDKRYIITFILGATLYIVSIIILKVIGDTLFPVKGAQTLASCFAWAVFPNRFDGKGVKYCFSHRALKRNREPALREAILLAGMAGTGYGFTEKLFYGGGSAMIFNCITTLNRRRITCGGLIATTEVLYMSILRTVAGVLVGITFGIELGISFKSAVVGFIAGVCFSILFGYTFNTVTHKKGK